MANVDTIDITKLIFVEQGSTPATPAATKQKLFVRSSDHLLCLVDSSGTVTPYGGALSNPMTTADDIIKGGSSGTPTRLAKGSAGAVLAMLNGVVTWNAGTSFPGSPATNDRYYRTDRGLEYYYDGTRWLTTVEYCQALGLLDQVMPLSSSPGNDLWAPTDLGANGQWITRLTAAHLLGGTNSGSHYWSFQFTSRTSAAVSHNIGSAYDTSADTASTWPKHTVTIGAAVTSGDTHLLLVQTKTGTPSTIYSLATVHYRLIG